LVLRFSDRPVEDLAGWDEAFALADGDALDATVTDGRADGVDADGASELPVELGDRQQGPW